jgi:N-acetylneuraminic acid mutarotase
MRFIRVRSYLFVLSILAVTLLSGSGHAQPPQAWQTKTPMPTGRYWAPAAVMDGKLYVAGGCCLDPFSPFPSRPNVVEVYDPSIASWANRQPIPIPVIGATDGVIDGKWYIAGGQPCCQNIATLQIYDPVLDQWSTGAPMPDRSAAGAGGVIDGELYVAGGMDAGNFFPVAFLRIYNPVSNTWRYAAPMPTARSNTAAAVIDGKLYVAGGGDAATLHRELEIYDPATNTWTAGPDMPTGRYGLGAEAVSGILYAIGGFDNISYLRTVETFDPVTGVWSQGAQMPEEHSWPSTGVIDGSLYVVGGANNVTSIGRTTDRFGPKTIPIVNVFGGSFMYNATSHPATASALGPNGFFLNGSFTFTYTPGGSSPPRNVGTYDVLATFVPADSNNYATATGNGTITITPSTANVFGPQSVTAEATSQAGAAPNFFVSAFDFDGPLTPICTPSGPGSVFPLGTTQVTCTAQGPNSSQGSTSFPVLVRDTFAPMLGNSSSVTVAATSSSGAVVTFPLPSATDTVDPHPLVTASPASGSLFPHGSTTVTITARDASGNTSTRTFTVTVTPSLLSISVTPSSATISPGGARQFSANGLFSDGSTRFLPSGGGGGGGGGGGNSGPGNFAWQVRFMPTFPVGACAPNVNGGLSSQAFSAVNGAVDAMWGQNNILHVTGSLNATTVNLSIACATGISPAPPVLSLSAAWTGTRYEGTLTGYSGQTIPVQITGWSSKAPMPTSRFALGAATLNVNGQDIVFAAGGVSGNSLLNTIEAYDPATNTWSPVSSMPTRREGPGVAGVNGKLYVVGGNVSGGSPSGIVEVYDPVTNAWSLPLPPLPTPRSHFSLVAAGSLLYAIGGDVAANGSAVTGVVERLDLSQPAPAWTMLNPMPTPRRFTAAGALNSGSLIVVVGGQQVNGPALNRTELFNVATNQWTQGPNILAPTVAPASAVVQNALFVFGGFNNGALILAELYRPASGLQVDGWAALSGMPTPRLEASAAVVGDVIYVIGGQDSGAGQAGMSTLEAFSILSPDQFTLSQGSSGGGGSSTPSVTWRLSPANGVATISPSGNATGNAPGQVSVIAEAGSISCVTTNTCGALTVANSIPSVSIFGSPVGHPAVTIDAGGNLSSSSSNAGSFFDNDNGQSWTATVDYGDGSGVQPLAFVPGGQQGPRGTFSLNHTYADTGHFNVVVRVTDSAGAQGSAFLSVDVVDRTPPVIGSVTPSVTSLRPPNHKMVPVTIAVQVFDAVDASPVCEVVEVASNEPLNGNGDGNTDSDWEIVPGSLTVRLRAERSGDGNGRIYTITVRCRDASGNTSTASTSVSVPH